MFLGTLRFNDWKSKPDGTLERLDLNQFNNPDLRAHLPSFFMPAAIQILLRRSDYP